VQQHDQRRGGRAVIASGHMHWGRLTSHVGGWVGGATR
jgi:hypothetical protein